MPGQYVRVGVEVDGVRLWRTYSLTHGPRADRCISITVKAIPDGVVSNHLVHRAQAGQMLQLAQAQGEFVLPQPIPPKLLLVTAGSGITPVIGMLRNLFSRTEPYAGDIVLLHSALTRDAVIFGPELRGYADRGLIRLVELHTDVARHARRRRPRHHRPRPGRADDVRLRAGRAARRARGALLRARPDAEHGAVPARRPWSPARAAPSPSPSGTIVEADGATPILDAAESAGVLMPSGCRMGICMGCVIPLKEGAVRDLRNGALTVAVPGETGPGGVPIQTCINAAAGPCSIDH